MRKLTLSALVWLGVLIVPAAAGAAASQSDDALVIVSGPAIVEAGQSVDGVFVVHGDARLDGTVTGDVFVLDGDVEVSGHVEGDLTTGTGGATLLRGAQVDGDLHYGDEQPEISPGATVTGKVSDEGWDDLPGVAPLIGALAIWLAVTISMLILGIGLVALFPRAADAVYAQAQARLPISVAFGIGTFIALPFAGVVTAITLVGLPLGIAILLALLPLAAIAYVTTAWTVGRTILKGRANRLVSFLAGFAILRVLALIPFLGALVWLAAVITGLGLLAAAIEATHSAPRSGTPTETPPLRSDSHA